VHGIPFLTQAISGKYQEITISIGALRYDSVRVAGIDARLIGVNAQLNDLLASNAKITVDEVIGTVVISKETIDARAPEGLKIEGTGDETLRVTGEIPVRNVRVPVTATMEFQVVKGGIRAQQLISWTVPLRNLPLDLKVTKVRSTPEGLEVEARAKDVPLKG